MIVTVPHVMGASVDLESQQNAMPPVQVRRFRVWRLRIRRLRGLWYIEPEPGPETTGRRVEDAAAEEAASISRNTSQRDRIP